MMTNKKEHIFSIFRKIKIQVLTTMFKIIQKTTSNAQNPLLCFQTFFHVFSKFMFRIF